MADVSPCIALAQPIKRNTVSTIPLLLHHCPPVHSLAFAPIMFLLMARCLAWGDVFDYAEAFIEPSHFLVHELV
jgi:hypothetical protein